MTQKILQSSVQSSRRRSGSLLVYVALGLFAFIGAASLAVDMGHLYSRKARAQQAADAAALGAAYQLANFKADSANPAPAVTAAQDYARLNGYDNANPSVTINTLYPIVGEPNRFRVQVLRQEPLFFARIFGLPTKPVGAWATAEYQTFAELSTTGGGVYGQPDGPTSLSMFGPDGFYNNGDYRSVRLLADRVTANPDYNSPSDPDPVKASKAGYDFRFVIPFDYTSTTIEVFDPDCHNRGDFANAGRNAAGDLIRVDELRSPTGAGGTTANATTTRYTLYWDAGDSNPFNDVMIGSPIEVGDDATKDLQWVDMFSFNRADYPTGQFRLNAVTISGSSENGFNLRARPTAEAFSPDNRTEVTASGYVPMNFNAGGNSTITLGKVPQEAAGKPLIIKKYDTDVGGQSVTYSYKTTDGTIVDVGTGVLAGNGEFRTDVLSLPLDYPGGEWRATYTAGNQDTSVWEMSYSAFTPGKPGPIRLVR